MNEAPSQNDLVSELKDNGMDVGRILSMPPFTLVASDGRPLRDHLLACVSMSSDFMESVGFDVHQQYEGITRFKQEVLNARDTNKWTFLNRRGYQQALIECARANAKRICSKTKNTTEGVRMLKQNHIAFAKLFESIHPNTNKRTVRSEALFQTFVNEAKNCMDYFVSEQVPLIAQHFCGKNGKEIAAKIGSSTMTYTMGIPAIKDCPATKIDHKDLMAFYRSPSFGALESATRSFTEGPMVRNDRSETNCFEYFENDFACRESHYTAEHNGTPYTITIQPPEKNSVASARVTLNTKTPDGIDVSIPLVVLPGLSEMLLYDAPLSFLIDPKAAKNIYATCIVLLEDAISGVYGLVSEGLPEVSDTADVDDTRNTEPVKSTESDGGKLPRDITGSEFIAIINRMNTAYVKDAPWKDEEKASWETNQEKRMHAHRRGKHRAAIYAGSGKFTPVAVHGSKAIPVGTLQNMLKHLEIDPKEFVKYV